MEFPFTLVDVFGAHPFSGNPLAVVHAADPLGAPQMQRMAQWFNLSETAFLLSPTNPAADYRVRIFDLERELAFAGHPTLGSCAAWLAQGDAVRDPNSITQECGAGLVTVRRVDGGFAFEAPPLLRAGPVDESTLGEVAQFLRIDPARIVAAHWADNGPGWIAVLLESAAAVLDVAPLGRHPERAAVGLVGARAPGGPAAFELRAFFTDQSGNVREDPVTGSLNASVAQWLISSGRAPDRYRATQGTALGRAGRIAIEKAADGRIWIAGNTHVVASGIVHR